MASFIILVPGVSAAGTSKATSFAKGANTQHSAGCAAHSSYRGRQTHSICPTRYPATYPKDASDDHQNTGHTCNTCPKRAAQRTMTSLPPSTRLRFRFSAEGPGVYQVASSGTARKKKSRASLPHSRQWVSLTSWLVADEVRFSSIRARCPREHDGRPCAGHAKVAGLVWESLLTGHLLACDCAKFRGYGWVL